MTKNQLKVKTQGYPHRISRAIRRKDENKKIYDLSAQFTAQVHYFPYGTLVDLVDAASRIYDMEPRAPRYNEPTYAEPEYV